MTQPCRNFKHCKGYAYDRNAKYCPRCWKRILEIQGMKTPLESLSFDDKNIYLSYAKEDLNKKERKCQ